jgi:hypothetical protein
MSRVPVTVRTSRLLWTSLDPHASCGGGTSRALRGTTAVCGLWCASAARAWGFEVVARPPREHCRRLPAHLGSAVASRPSRCLEVAALESWRCYPSGSGSRRHRASEFRNRCRYSGSRNHRRRASGSVSRCRPKAAKSRSTGAFSFTLRESQLLKKLLPRSNPLVGFWLLERKS